MFTSRRWLWALGPLLLLLGLAFAAHEVFELERNELEHESEWRTLEELAKAPGATRISARLTELALRPGEDAIFELCSRDQLAPVDWDNRLDVVVWQPASQRLELKVPLDKAHLELVKHGRDRSCLTLGGGQVKNAGKYALDLVWAGKPALGSAQRNVALKARILARRRLSTREALLVLTAALGALLTVLSGFGAPQAPSSPAAKPHAPWWALLGSLVAGVLSVLVLYLPLPGAIGGLGRGLVLAAIQVGTALGLALLVYRLPRGGLALYAPIDHAGAWLFGAMVCALLLRPLARLALGLVPSTGEAPIEAFISWPSGALAFAALGMVVPIAEELFFRGFVYGALAPLGRLVAIPITTLLFAGVHAPQTWGNWGALLAVTLTGAVLTALRAASGSTLVPAVAHLLYNLTLWSDSFRG